MQKRWWLFHATDFQTLMHPCFIVCRIVGMFPYKINDSTFEFSLPCYILSTVVAGFYCVFHLLRIYDVINSEIIDYRDIFDHVGSVCYNMYSGLIVIVTYILSNSRMRLLQTISEIYSKLPSESHRMLSRLIHTKDILGIILTLQQLLNFILMSIETYWDVISLLCKLCLDMLVFQMNMLYMNCICVLKVSFKKINDNLMHMQSDIINEMEPPVFSLICLMRKNQLFLIEVKTLMKQHLMISETVQKLNLIFSLQLLATMSLSVFAIVVGLYEFLYWQDGVQIAINTPFYVFLLLFMFMIYYISQITLIIWACEACKNQAHEIGTTVCYVHNTIRDDQIKGEVRLRILIFFSCICLIWDLTLQLRLFSLQVLHHKNIFSIKGVTMDATLLTSIVGISTTYLFILVQFIIMTHSCD